MNYQELEEALCRLPSVDAVRVVGNGRSITELHVLASPEKSPKQVVRDVQSLAMARFGLSVDRRVISVVQMETSGGSAAERPAIVGIREVPDGTRATVSVTLSWRGQTYVGEASGPSASSARLRLVGEATLRALEETLSGPALGLDGVGTATIGSHEVAIAEVVTVMGGDEQVLVGSALVRGDPTQAVVRAVLDAVNRSVPQLSR